MKSKLTYTAEESRAMLAKEREDYKSPKGHASWWQKDGAWHIALPNGKGSFLWTADAYDSREQAIVAIEGIPASAPLNLCPPTGVTGTTLPDPPVKDTPDYKGKTAKEYAAGKTNGAIDAAESPKSILTLDNERKAAIGIKSESELVRAYWEGWLEGWNGGHAPASPVDSVGVPAPQFMLIHDKAGNSPVTQVTVETMVSIEFAEGQLISSVGEIVAALRSHAAKDAKIKELESLLLECVRDMTAAHIVDNILYKEKNPTRPQLPEPASLIAARAALALPCA